MLRGRLTPMQSWTLPILLILAASSMGQPPKAGANLLRQAFGTQPLNQNPLLIPEFPAVSLLFANRVAEVQSRDINGDAILRAPGSDAILVASLERRGIFNFCRIRHQAGS